MQEKLSATFTAGLIAGGKSSRMGRDKAFVTYQGKPLWKHQADRLLELQPAHLLISGKPEQIYESYSLITDLVADAGPLAGIAALLSAIETPLLLVLAVDMPNLKNEWLKRLLTASTATCGAISQHAAHQSFSGLYEPLAAVYPRESLSIANELLGARDLSLQTFARRLVLEGLANAVTISPTETAMFKSMNEPSDLE